MADIFTDRPDVNSLFGTFTPSSTNMTIDATNINNNNVYDYILRDPGIRELQQDILQVQTNMDIKFNPSEYINNKNLDLQTITRKLRDYFKVKFALYMSNGYSQKESEKKAMEETNRERESLMKLHKRSFPKEVDQLQAKFL